MRQDAREVFTVNGKIGMIREGIKRFIPLSPMHAQQQFNELPVGKKVSMTISEWDAIRSDDQLRYHMVLMGYLAKHTGFTKQEMHDAVMRLRFGEKVITIAGRTTKIRQSIAAKARMKKHEVTELIEYDLELCRDLDIHVPTAAELGYLPS